MAAKTDWREALQALVEVGSTDLAERRRLGIIIATTIADARGDARRHETSEIDAGGKRKPRRDVQKVAESGEPAFTGGDPVPNEEAWLAALNRLARGPMTLNRESDAFARCQAMVDRGLMIKKGTIRDAHGSLAAITFALTPAGRQWFECGDPGEPDPPGRALRAVGDDADLVCKACGERPPREQDAFCSNACAREFPDMVAAALALALDIDERPAAQAAARRFVATWHPKVQVAIAEWAQAIGAAHVGPVTERMLEIDRGMSEAAQNAIRDFRALFERGAKREIAVGVAVELAPVAPQEREDAVLDAERWSRLDERARLLGFTDAQTMLAREPVLTKEAPANGETCTCPHAPEDHTTDAGRASREGIGRAAARLAHREAGSPQIVTLSDGGKLTMVEEPEPACPLCGEAPAYVGACFCGAACSSRWEAGERPVPRPFDKGMVIKAKLLARMDAEPPEVFPASRDAVCAVCTKRYAEHPPLNLGNDLPAVTLCDGVKVRLTT